MRSTNGGSLGFSGTGGGAALAGTGAAAGAGLDRPSAGVPALGAGAALAVGAGALAAGAGVAGGGALLAIPPLPGAPARVALIDLAIGDLLLQLNDRVHQCIWARWTACHVYVNGQEVVHARDRAVRALIWSAGGRTHAHRNDVLG